MRVVFETGCDRKILTDALTSLAARLGLEWRLRSTAEKQRVLLLVSKFDHCLGDLLYRTRIGELNMEVVGIVSNHPRDALKISVGADGSAAFNVAIRTLALGAGAAEARLVRDPRS